MTILQPVTQHRPLVSVVVCTYNRSRLLEQVLQDLCGQTLDSCYFEVIIVDNNSSDLTPEVAGKYQQHENIRYLKELRQGLSNARNTGWQAACAEYVAYVDDDCRIPPVWLEHAREIIEQQAPSIFGGPIFPFYDSPKPAWFHDSYHTHWLGHSARSLDNTEFLYGGNLFLRRSLLERLGGFNPELGVTGDKLAYGEETSLQAKTRQVLPEALVFYHPKLHVNHLVRAEKMTLFWGLKSSFADGRHAHLLVDNPSDPLRAYGLMITTIGTSLALGKDLLTGSIRDKVCYPNYKNYLYERAFGRVRTFGALCEAYKRWLKSFALRRTHPSPS